MSLIRKPTAPIIPMPAKTILMLIQYVFQSGLDNVFNRRPADWKNPFKLMLFTHWIGKY